MSRLFKFFILFVCLVQYIKSDGYYTIVGSKSIRPNEEYRISVNSHRFEREATIRVGIEAQNGGVQYTNYQEVVMNPLDTKMATLNIGNVTLTNCKLVAEGVRGITFKNSTELFFNNKTISMFALTDKAVYKPGDKVKFRVIVLDSNLLPKAHKSELNILITDANKNQIRKYVNEPTKNGVFSSEIELSMAPVLGTWSINFQILNTVLVKTFDVQEYVLPQFEVIIDTQRHNTLDAKTLTATIYSRYTFGKLVKGKLTIRAHATDYIGARKVEKNVVVHKTINTEGKYILNLDIANDLRINVRNEDEVDVIIEATVEEALTGRKQSTTATISVHLSKYVIEFISDTSSYKPGLPYTAWIKVNYHDGTPVKDTANKVIITYGAENEEIINNLTLDDNGRAKLYFDPNSNFDPDSITAEYKSATAEHAIPSKNSDNDVFIQAKLSRTNPIVGENMNINIHCTERLSYITYVLIGRGLIIQTATIPIPNKKYHLFKIMATFAMIPKAKLLVYYVHESGQIIFDAIDIRFASNFQNNVSLDLSTSRCEPATNISITVKAKPNSFVGILGVDQSVLLLKKGNNLDMEEIFKDLMLYDGKSNLGSGSIFEFENAGATVITNVKPATDIYEDEEHITMASGGSSENIRKDFPETWIWDTIDNIGGGEITLRKTAPDSITSFILTAFAIDSEYGFGMTPIPKKLEVFKQFFVSTNLPYSIKQGETVKIPIVVFNYLNRPLRANIILDNTLLEYDIMDPTNEMPETIIDSYNKEIDIEANSGASVHFMIKPKTNGYITIKIKATSEIFADIIEKKLLVVPEGITKYVDLTTFVDVRTGNEFNKVIDIVVPDNAVQNSTRIQLTVFGDIFGPTVQNLNSLIRLPGGCGEQTMLSLVPNIVVLNYLNITQQLTPALRTTAIDYMNKGYQNELRYKRGDGSFTVFQSDNTGSSWLTAYVTRFFVKASKFIYVDEEVIKRGLQWLSNHQAASGNFPEIGRVVHKEMQGESAGGIALTAFTLLAFLENEKYAITYASTITKATGYIASNINTVEDVYILAIAAYALQLGRHSSRHSVLTKLREKAKVEGEYLYWSKKTTNAHLSGLNCVNIEITGYALMAYLEANLVTESLPIVKWLAAQTNNHGGFRSTQDTVIALQALGKFPVAGLTPNYNVKIKAKYNGVEQASWNVNRNNSMVLQSRDLPSSLRQVTITGSGSGVGVARLSYQYNVGGTGSEPRFALTTSVSQNTTRDYLHISVCANYIPKGNDKSPGMTLIEVGFPSGFTVNEISAKLLRTYKIQKLETKDSKTILVLYFVTSFAQPTCVPITASRTYQVADLKPAPVTIYDYYDSTRNARMFYSIPGSLLCDICEGEDCPASCK